MRCPGQDRRYWTENAVFEVPCPECGAAVEFFKDETSGRCTKCGHRFQNPGMDFGCASWCSLAEQCLGFVPEGGAASGATEGALAGRLIQQLGERLKDEPTRMIVALKAFHHAKELAPKEGAVPRIALAGALLVDLAADPNSDAEAGRPDGLQTVQQVLEQAGADGQTVDAVCRIVQANRTGHTLDGPEFAVVHDAARLARLTTDCSPDQRDKVNEIIEEHLVTESAKQTAHGWCRAAARDADPQDEHQV